MSLLPQQPSFQHFYKAPLLRRLIAELLDGLIPLPFLAGILPIWLAIPLAYTLFADSRGASLGKRLLGLRVVRVSTSRARHGLACNVGRSMLRNGGYVIAGLCTLSAVLTPVGMLFPLAEGVMVLARSDGRRLGDLLAGTQVVATEEVRW